MRLKTAFIFSALALLGSVAGFSGTSYAHRSFGGQVCSLGTAAVGQPGPYCSNKPKDASDRRSSSRRTGKESFTSAAASTVGLAAFDLDLRDGLVGIQAMCAGGPVLLTYSRRSRGDFLTLVSEFAVGTTSAAGALLLQRLAR